MPDGGHQFGEWRDNLDNSIIVTKAVEAVTAILAQADLERIQATTSFMSDRVWAAIAAAQSIGLPKERPSSVLEDPERKEFFIPGC